MYCFGDCVLDAELRELRCGGVLCHVEPQVFDLLEYLIRNRGRVVSRDDLFAAVWNGRMVSDSILSTRLNAARRAIGDNGAEQRLIRTFRRKGLRFVASVREVKAAPFGAPQVLSARLGCTPLTEGTPRIAVLPFANMTADRKYEHFAVGLAEEIIASLTRRNLLAVASRISSFSYSGKALRASEIARRLRVRYLLEGSLHQCGDRVRIVVRLVDGLVDRQLWAERFDRHADDGFAIQDEIAANILAAITPEIYFAEEIRASRKSLERLNAWECIVHALSLINNREKPLVGTAHRLLQKAVVLDPQSAQAHSLLSIVTTLSIHMGWSKRHTFVPRSLAMAHKALSLNADEPWAHAALGYATIWKRAA
jgi:TolB-like protein/DNA-binding winged helix-turn-helix (wHTH) protein